MNFLNVFEERISGIFGSSAAAAAPFSFKKLAKKASGEMENETYVINGVDTAPALFTVLVSQEDNAVMQPLYANLTQEVSLFLEAHAQRRGYTFVGEPLVRFMVDPALKHGKFSVFAENVDARTLERLREEERAYTGEPSPAPASAGADLGLGPMGSPTADGDGLDVMSADTVLDAVEDAYAHNIGGGSVLPSDYRSPGTPVQEPLPRSSAAAYDNPASAAVRRDQRRAAHDASQLAAVPQPVATPQPVQPVAAPQPAAAPVAPPTQRRNVPLVNPHHAQTAPSAMLIDRQTGRTYACTSERCVIGRERTTGGIVLHDPNVSRRHAEIDCTNGRWSITDLNSTNGTLVNDVDIDQCVLRDGDLITLGLTNLEFREG